MPLCIHGRKTGEKKVLENGGKTGRHAEACHFNLCEALSKPAPCVCVRRWCVCGCMWDKQMLYFIRRGVTGHLLQNLLGFTAKVSLKQPCKELLSYIKLYSCRAFTRSKCVIYIHRNRGHHQWKLPVTTNVHPLPL